MKKGLIFLMLAVFALSAGFGCSKSLPPVKEIQISGMPLDIKTMIFSKLNTPVSPDALVQVPGKQETIIVNVFPSDLKGVVESGIKPEVIMVNGTDHFKLDQTMSKKKLAPGTYLMNIVFAGKTERVLLSVK